MGLNRFCLIFTLLLFNSSVVFAADNKTANPVQANPQASGNVLPSGRDIVEQCDNKYPGEDQQSELSITLTDRSGNTRNTVYLRLWRDLKGEENIVDKMVLFTLHPPDAKGAAFMRWAYTKSTDKNAEQWIYLPVLRKIRRVSVRDLSDSFLGSDLTYGDISLREIDEDRHELKRVVRDKAGQLYYEVHSIPLEAKPQYSRKIAWFRKSNEANGCVKVRVDYYDTKKSLLKQQFIKWQKVDKAWVWDKVKVKNAQTFHESFFEVAKVKINRGINDEWFTERRLRLGIKQ
ncbi:MAG: outer membrane lipoprotein-sorting protein [Gammaproteobacteria bacterium]|nr:outer membrane lipoprotein-sorting protein [Gammaproteobacteria bacterium]MDH5729556.1 outer membrane lipoprotein-sorting protein [Gammaproteobacteria bacterium]